MGEIVMNRNHNKMYRRWSIFPRFTFLGVLLLLLGVIAGSRNAYAQAQYNYEVGHITRVSYTQAGVLIMMDGTLPTNCSGTTAGWMLINSSYPSMVAFTTGLWMRGDASSVSVTVYTAGIDSTTFCEVNQIDTGGNGD